MVTSCGPAVERMKRTVALFYMIRSVKNVITLMEYSDALRNR